MQSKNYQEEALIRYLLGQLSEAEQTRVEEKYFDDPAYFEQLKIAEAELIDAYVNGRLTAADRAAFEQSLSPRRRQRTAFAAVWREYLEQAPVIEQEEKRRTFFSAWFKKPSILIPLTATLLLAVCGVWMMTQNRTLNPQLSKAVPQAQVEPKVPQPAEPQPAERLTQDQAAAEAPPPLSPIRPAANPVASVTLSAGTIRSSGAMRELEVYGHTKTIEFILLFQAADYSRYSAVIEKASGAQVLNKTNLASQSRGAQKRAVWRLSRKSLPGGDYLLTLRGIKQSGESEDLAEYPFRILQR